MSKKTLVDAEKILAVLQKQNNDIYDEFQAVPEKITEAQTIMEKALRDGKPTSGIEKEIFALIKQREEVPFALEELKGKIDDYLAI